MRSALEIPPGIVTDETTFATPGRWADGNNVRFWFGRPQVVGGWSSAVSGLTGVCRNSFAWTDNDANINIAFGTHSALQVLVGGELFDITPSGLAAGVIDGGISPGYGTSTFGNGTFGTTNPVGYQPRTWSLQNYGEWLIAAPRGGTIYSWQNNTANDAAALTNAPAQVNVVIVTPERQIVALGANEEVSTNYNPMCIRGSDIEGPTVWATSPTNNAFEHILEGGGKIISGAMVGNYLAVWTDVGLHVGQFVGQSGQTYRFDLVAKNCGLIGPNAMTVFNQVAYWVTPDLQFYRWSPGSPPLPLACPIRNDFADNLERSQSDKVVCCPVSKYDEVWWFYPDSRDGIENSRYVAVNTRDGAWFKGQIARTAAMDSGPTADPLFVAYDGHAYWHETGNTANGGALSWSLTTSDQYLDTAQRRTLVRGLWPDFEDQTGAISLTISYRDYPQSTPRSKGPWTLGVGLEKRDFLVEGRIASVTLSANSAPSYMRLGRPSFDVVVTGEK